MIESFSEPESSPLMRPRASDGVVFSSSKCPPGSGLRYSCELPFGFVWTPMAVSSNAAVLSQSTDEEALPTILCLTCLSYLNLYASFDASTGVWICPLCGESNVAPAEVFGSLNDLTTSNPLASIMVSPVVEYRQRISNPLLSSEIRTGGTLESCTYVLVLDGNLPGEEAQAVATAIQLFLRQASTAGGQVRLGLVLYTNVVSMYQLGVLGIASADIYTTSQAALEEEDEQELISRRTNMAQKSYLLDVETENDLTPFWQCLSAVYRTPLNPENFDAEPSGSGMQTSMSRREQLRLRKEARLRKKQQDTNAHEFVDTNQSQSPNESPWLKRHTEKSSQSLRCTGEAIQCAIDMAEFGSNHPPRTSRILLFTNGCPNMGKASVVKSPINSSTQTLTAQNFGAKTTPDVVDAHNLTRAVKFFSLVGKDASECGIGIDVFCTGVASLGMPTYQALVEPSGGYALPHESFRTPHLAYNLGIILGQTHVSRAGVVEDSFRGAAPVTNEMDGCIVDLRMSSFVSPTHIVGPSEILYGEHGLLANERSAFAAGASLAATRGFRTNNLPRQDILEASLTRLRMGRFDPLATLSTMLQVNDSFQPDDRHSFFQCIVRYVEPDGQTLVTRVCTHRLPVSRSIYDFLDDISEEVVPVILGKEAVYRAIVGRDEPQDVDNVIIDADRLEMLASEAQRDLDATIHRISGAFRLLKLQEGSRSNGADLSEEGGVAASQSSLDFAFPPELADALHRLFHLRRGALLSPGPLQSMDDRAETRSLFLRLPLDDCLCMMAPSLWSSSLDVLLQPIPSDTLALWDTCVIAADHHDSMFVWSGRGTTGKEYDVIRKQCFDFLRDRSLNRFPMPRTHILAEGESMCRRFTSRLAPSHADPEEQQLVHFPALATLPAAELTALRDKFRFYDASLDASFRRWFWGVASASSNARDEGMSLCH